MDPALATWLAGSPLLLAAAVVWLIAEVRRQGRELRVVREALLRRGILDPIDGA